MPFGLSPAPEEFQRRMKSVLQDLPGVKVIADDILIFGKSVTDAEAFADHDRNLTLLMDRCQNKGLKLNSKKLQLKTDARGCLLQGVKFGENFSIYLSRNRDPFFAKT